MKPRQGYIHIKLTNGWDIIMAAKRAAGNLFYMERKHGLLRFGLIGNSPAQRLIVSADNHALIARDGRYSILHIRWYWWSDSPTIIRPGSDELNKAVSEFEKALRAELGNLVKS